MTTAADISGRAMLVCLKISAWTARKFDKRVTKEINETRGASQDAGRYNKMLLPGDAEPYRRLVKVCNAARGDHYAQTLAWSDEGWRLLPTANYMEYSEMLRGHAAAFDAALADFIAAYPDLKEAARVALNGLYRPEDYPGVSELGRRFRFSIDYAPLPARGDFRLSLPDGELARLESSVEDRVTRATREALADAWGRLGDVVGKMHARLAEPGAIFRDSLITNVRELADVLTRLNVTGDADLEAMRLRVASDLCRHEPDTLRKDADVREDTAAKAAAIMEAMGDLYGGPDHD